MKLGLLNSTTQNAQDAAAALRARYDFVAMEDADIAVILGGDGFMLHSLHAMLEKKQTLPVFGMNRGTFGFLMNAWQEDDLLDRVQKATAFPLRPLRMEATTLTGTRFVRAALNEVSLLRETRQAAKIAISIDGSMRMHELTGDGILVATPAGSTAYNYSANGPILPLGCDLLALTPISPFRPRRWRGALLPDSSEITFEILDAGKRPVSAVADQREVRDVTHVHVTIDTHQSLTLLFDPEYALDDRIVQEQFST